MEEYKRYWYEFNEKEICLDKKEVANIVFTPKGWKLFDALTKWYSFAIMIIFFLGSLIGIGIINDIYHTRTKGTICCLILLGIFVAWLIFTSVLEKYIDKQTFAFEDKFFDYNNNRKQAEEQLENWKKEHELVVIFQKAHPNLTLKESKTFLEKGLDKIDTGE